jgi:c-di-GMP-binding flagellar brake protein YcgR
MILLIALSAFVLLLLGAAATLVSRGPNRYSPLEFYLKTREAGMSLGDARRLRSAAGRAGIADPTIILNSPRDLDRAITVLRADLARGGGESAPGAMGLVDRVYSLRKLIELDQPRFKYGIKSSRAIGQGQRVRILVHGLGVFDSTVLDNHERYLTISYPAGNMPPKGWVWKGKKVSLYFFRRDDAGYVFDSYVIDDLRIRNVPVLQVSHSESLLRTQKRKSVRARSRLPAFLYLLKRVEGAYEKPESAPGLRALIQDLSEDGVAVAIGGKAVAGLNVKVQFSLGERKLVMSGTVRSVDYDSEKNRSVLHVQAVPPSPKTRDAIRTYVYTIRGGRGEIPNVAEGVG